MSTFAPTKFVALGAAFALLLAWLVRSRRWRYIHYPSSGADLYDMRDDPRQLTNLAGRAEAGNKTLQGVIRGMKRALCEAAPDGSACF